MMMGYCTPWHVGEMLAPPLRIYLAGEVCVERGEALLRESGLPRRQGRIALAVLVAEHSHGLTRDDLAEILWPYDLPTAWDNAVRVLISKIRSAARTIGWPYAEPIETAFGAYQLQLPAGTWIDIEVALDSVHRAEALMERGEARAAYGWALV